MQSQEEFDAKRLAECLISFFKLMPNENQLNRFVIEIARQTIRKLEAGHSVEISTKEIFLEMFPNGDESQASSKLANIWRKLPSLYEKTNIHLAEYAVNEFELNAFPWPDKIDSEGGAGNLVRYRLKAISVNKELIAEPNPYRTKIEHDIEYIAVQDYKPSLLARLIFNNSNALIGGKKWIMVFFSIFEMLFYLCLIGLFLYSMKNQTLATYPLWQLAIFIGAIWLFVHKKKRIDRFLDDRIIIASEYFMGFHELSLVQELVTVNDENGNFLYKKVQLTKYVAKCPICNAQVELAKGEPDFPRRIVGRCKECPTEHVFSFDRITKLGHLLRSCQ